MSNHHVSPLGIWIGGAIVLALISAGVALYFIRSSARPVLTVVSSVSYSNGDENYQPGAGRKYAIVDVEVKNPSSLPFDFAPVVQSYLTDEAGNKYYMAPTELKNPIEAGPIQPGETRRGQLSYNVSTKVQSLQFHFVSTDSYHLSYTKQL